MGDEYSLNVKIITNIDNKINNDEIEITIKASNNSLELTNIINSIQEVSNSSSMILGKKQNKIYILQIDDIILFYSSNNNIYCKTLSDEYIVNKKIYEIEQNYCNKFIRISKSHIINVSCIESFDLSYIGNIIVKLKNGETQNVAKRRIPQVMKFINSLKS